MNDWRLRLVPSAGQDVAKNGRHRGEISAAHARVDEFNQRDANVVRAMHRFCRRESASCGRARMSCKRRSQGVKKTLRQKSILSDSKPVPFNDISKSETSLRRPKSREMRMARLDSGYLPRGNPCAQCGKPIARPDWVESSPGRTSFLWFCRACDYRFEAVAIYEEADPDALAA